MRRLLLLLILVLVNFTIPVQAIELTVPEVPISASDFMPPEPGNLQEGILYVLKAALSRLRPDLKEAAGVCIGIFGAVAISSIIRPVNSRMEKVTDLTTTVAVVTMFLSSAGALINMGAATVAEVSEYGKLLLPVLGTALAAQGGISTSAALYTATGLFDAVLSSLISNILLPMVYIFLALSAANGATGEDLLKKLRDFVKWAMTWMLKITLYVFTGFISITGVVSGPTDAATLKAAKLTISGMVPVIGGILSDASEAVLVSAGTVKNSIGLYGMFAVLALWISPFLRIGAHYIMLRMTGGVCSIFSSKRISELIQDLASSMGFLLAMTGSVCVMILISTVCFMRGVS